MIEVFRISVLIVGAIPLIIYPFVMLASIMGLAAQTSSDVPLFKRFLSKLFLWGTLVYPLIYLSCFYCSYSVKQMTGLAYALAPFVFLLVIWASYRLMGVLSVYADSDE